MAVPVTMIFNRSLSENSVPADWKHANVSAVFKQGSTTLAENYRPISLTCHLSKVLESVIRDEIIHHLNKSDLLKSTQHGFRQGRSCTTNLLAFLDRVTSHVDNGHGLGVVFLDFAKAFDKVPHGRLMEKSKALSLIHI